MAGLAPRTPTADDLARMRAEAESLRAAKADARSKAEARQIGLLAMIEVGVTVFAAVPDEADFAGRGGVVVAIDERVDEGTGEVDRVFTCLHGRHGRLSVVHVPQAEVTEWSVTGTSSSDLVRIMGLIARELAEDWGGIRYGNSRARTRLVLPTHADRVHWLHLLTKVAMTGSVAA